MKITTLLNQDLEIDGCMGCYLARKNIFKEGLIAETQEMSLTLDLELAYPGMMILSPKRHVEYFDQLTTDEMNDWNKLLSAATQALREDSSCTRISYFFRSFPEYHIHLAIMPVWENGAYQNDYTILPDLVTDCEKLRKENGQKVLAYRDILQAKISSYLGHR